MVGYTATGTFIQYEYFILFAGDAGDLAISRFEVLQSDTTIE